MKRCYVKSKGGGKKVKALPFDHVGYGLVNGFVNITFATFISRPWEPNHTIPTKEVLFFPQGDLTCPHNTDTAA